MRALMNVEKRDVGKPFGTVRTRVLETLHRLVGFPSSIYSLGSKRERERERERETVTFYGRRPSTHWMVGFHNISVWNPGSGSLVESGLYLGFFI